MIFHPRVGQEVKIRYRQSLRPLSKFHNMTGRVLQVGKGKGPVNVLVGISVLRWHPGTPDIQVVVPRGNLFAI